MAKDTKEQTIVEEAVAPAPEPTEAELMQELQNALTKGDFRAVATISRKIDQKTKAAEKAELDAKHVALAEVEGIVKKTIIDAVTPLYDSGQLDAADGVWLSWDFGEQAPTLRLTKTATRTAKAGGGTGKKFDISTDNMLAKHGTEMYKDSGMTIRQAYDQNTDKNYRYAVRQKLLKLEGII